MGNQKIFWLALHMQMSRIFRADVDDPRQFSFRLNDRELALFKKNGFVVSERLGPKRPREQSA